MKINRIVLKIDLLQWNLLPFKKKETAYKGNVTSFNFLCFRFVISKPE